MSRSTRRGVLTAAVFVLAAIGGAIGNQLSQRLDAAAISFAVVLVLGAIAAVALDRSVASEKPPGPGGPKFDLRGTSMENVQIGDHTVMYNDMRADTRGSRRQSWWRRWLRQV